MKETANLDKLEAAADAFGGERLRWLIGKGDVQVHKGELTQERLQQLMEQTVNEEIDRSRILKEIQDGPATITEIAKATKMEKDHILENLLALMKWNLVEIVGDEKREYIYARKEI
ncbi:MAG: winged helix-turn-helix domain-containing protein [Candidatus Thorarchaeota archaeon]|jgi:predicted Rossmann fold nucleotide-binding protein DprA/Smf involved in DNA uptake